MRKKNISNLLIVSTVAVTALMGAALTPVWADHHEEAPVAESGAAPEKADVSDNAALLEEARGLVKKFSGTLGQTLMGGFEEGGVEGGITVCHGEAPKIAAQLSAETGWDLARTSAKLRNPDNAPDEWESMVLAEFAKRQEAGEDVKAMEFSAIDGHTFRYMKAIPMGEGCLACHGSDVDPDTMGTISSLYPEDKATGFGVGTVRGAFTLRKELAE